MPSYPAQRAPYGLKPPHRYGYDEACVVNGDGDDESLPSMYEEALKRDDGVKWLEAMKFEFESLSKIGTWESVEPPQGRKAVQTKWVFSLKRDGRGMVMRFKARMVAKWFSQIYGIDFFEVFSPVSHHATIQLMFAFAVLFGWKWIMLDVKKAFVNASLEEEINIAQPSGFVVKGEENHVYRLRKALYGLRQASRKWNKILENFLRHMGYEQCEPDLTLHFLRTKSYL